MLNRMLEEFLAQSFFYAITCWYVLVINRNTRLIKGECTFGILLNLNCIILSKKIKSSINLQFFISYDKRR